jgi:hypothetical protein
VATVDARVEVLQEPNLAPVAPVPLVAGQCDEVQIVDDRQSPREVGDEDDGRFQRRDQDRLEAFVIGSDLRAQLLDAGLDLLPCEVDLADALVDVR